MQEEILLSYIQKRAITFFNLTFCFYFSFITTLTSPTSAISLKEEIFFLDNLTSVSFLYLKLKYQSILENIYFNWCRCFMLILPLCSLMFLFITSHPVYNTCSIVMSPLIPSSRHTVVVHKYVTQFSIHFLIFYISQNTKLLLKACPSWSEIKGTLPSFN